MNEQVLPLMDGPVRFAGAVSLEQTDTGVQPWRLVREQLGLFESPLRERAACAAGVRLTVISDTSEVRLTVNQMAAEAPPAGQYDLLVDGKLHQRVDNHRGAHELRFTDLPRGEHRLEIYLPQNPPVRLERLAIDAGASAKPWDDPRPRWVVYGSSITQCNEAAGPSETWPALVANRFDLNLTCLGYGGNCHLEPVVARMIRDLPADYISLCAGINTHGGSLSDRTFRAMVLGLILTIREKHPTTPMVCVSPICSPPRETEPSPNGNTLVRMRQRVAEAVKVLQERGDAHLHYADGLELFGEAFIKHMPDELHPDAEGYRVLAEQYSKVVMPHLGLTPAVG